LKYAISENAVTRQKKGIIHIANGRRKYLIATNALLYSQNSDIDSINILVEFHLYLLYFDYVYYTISAQCSKMNPKRLFF